MYITTQNNLKRIFISFSFFFFINANCQTVTTFTGSIQGYADGAVNDAKFNTPSGIAAADDGTIFIFDAFNYRIRKITPEGIVTTFAGGGTNYEGTGTDAQLSAGTGIAVDHEGNVFFTDDGLHRIRKITPAGVVSTFAGSTVGYADGTGTDAKFNTPTALTIDASGNLFVADASNNCIRKITPTGIVTTFAGSTNLGYNDGPGTAARFSYPSAIAIDIAGNFFVSDRYNFKIRKITPAGQVTTVAGSTQGFADGTAADAQFNSILGIASDTMGNIFVTDGSRIRKISNTKIVSTFAGSTSNETGYADGTGTEALFTTLVGIAAISDGTLLVADAHNHRIRKITYSLGTTDDVLENQFLLYPNPASTNINIKFNDVTAASVTILEINGRILQSEKIHDSQSLINISNLLNGIYIMQITTYKGTVYKKIIKR